MKKIVALLLAMAMILALAACGAKTEAPAAAQPTTGSTGTTTTQTTGGDTTTGETETFKLEVVKGSNESASGKTDKDVYIDIWGIYGDTNHRAEWIRAQGEAFAAEFEAEYGVSVCIEYYSQNDYGGVATKLAAGVSGGALPVLSQISSQQAIVFAPLCDDISKYLSEEGLNNYVDSLLASCIDADGKVFGVPSGRSSVAYIVNMDLIEAAGYTLEDVQTWNWEKFHEIMAACAALGDDIEGIGLYWDTDAWFWESALYSNGGYIDNADGTKILFHEDGNGGQFLDLVAEMTADGSMCNLYNEYHYKEVDDALDVMFVDGKLACRMGSISTYGTYKNMMNEKGVTVNQYMAPQPAGDGGFSHCGGGNNMLFLNQSTETQKFVAAKFMEYLARPEVDLSWNDCSGYMPVNEQTYESEGYKALIAADPGYALAELTPYVHAFPVTERWAEVRSYLMDGLIAWAQDPEACKAQYGGTTDSVVDAWAAHSQSILDEM